MECLILADRLLINILKKRGPRVEHYGTPTIQRENFPKTQIKEDISNK
jgi:hypothetical protein